MTEKTSRPRANSRPTSSEAEEIRLLRAELAATRAQLSNIRFEIDSAVAAAARYKAQLRVLRRSMSWRVTRPLRAFRRSRNDSL